MGVEPSSSDRPARLGAGQGPVRRAVKAALVEAREANRMTLEHEVRAVLADRYAELVDRASSAGDQARLLRAGDQLLEVLDTLPVRPSGAGGGGAGDGSGDERGRLLQLMDSPPSVGDSANG